MKVSLVLVGLIVVVSVSILIFLGLRTNRSIEILYPTATVTPTLPPIDLQPLPTPQPRPEFINNVSPPESSIVSIDVYRSMLDMGGIHFDVRPTEAGYNNSICVNLNTGPLLEKDDRLVEEEVVRERITIYVDGQALTDWNYSMWYDTAICTNDVEGCNTFGLTHTTNAIGYDWIIYCWTADVGSGSHQVQFQFQQTSGNIQEYQWSFGLTNESVPVATFTPVPRRVERQETNSPLCDEEVESYDSHYVVGISVADLLNSCGRPDLIYISTLDFRLVHLVYLSKGLEAQIFHSASFGFASGIYQIDYFEPMTEDGYGLYPYGKAIDPLTWDEAFGE